jgi:hypothetical protein
VWSSDPAELALLWPTLAMAAAGGRRGGGLEVCGIPGAPAAAATPGAPDAPPEPARGAGARAAAHAGPVARVAAGGRVGWIDYVGVGLGRLGLKDTVGECYDMKDNNEFRNKRIKFTSGLILLLSPITGIRYFLNSLLCFCEST